MIPLILNQQPTRVPRAWLKLWLAGLSRALARRGHPRLARREVVVVFVSRREIRRLNAEFRGKDYATDILSFAGVEPGVLGELVLCPDVIVKQSQDTGLTPRGELGYMLVHGVLHLLGHDHETDAERARMFALQDALYAKLENSVGLR